jgi:hypothetical protein
MANHPAWKDAYLKASNEPDKKKLAGLAFTAEGAMRLRLQELSDSDDSRKERNEIQIACAELLAIEIDKLGWPAALL